MTDSLITKYGIVVNESVIRNAGKGVEINSKIGRNPGMLESVDIINVVIIYYLNSVNAINKNVKSL